MQMFPTRGDGNRSADRRERDVRNPFSHRQLGSGEAFVTPEEEQRIQEHNSSVERRRDADKYKLHHLHPTTGALLPPLAWSGNPFEAKVMLLLKNPSWDEKALDLVTEPEHFERFERVAHCVFGPSDYHNPHLHPDYRDRDYWHAHLFSDLRVEIKKKFRWNEEKVWLFLSQAVCVMELVPWRSKLWDDGGVVSNLHRDFIGPRVREAMADPNRMVVMGRGETQWKMMVDAGVSRLAKIKNVQHMTLNRKNMQSSAYRRMLELLTAEAEKWDKESHS